MVMLLTKPLTSFLNANRTPQLHTLLLITPTGKVLSSASPHPASVLRTQATIACSLYAQYVPIASSGTISSALPSQSRPQLSPTSNNGPTASSQDLTSILIQLDHGTTIIRPLRCSLLFVAIGPSPSAYLSSTISTSAQALGHELDYLALSAAASPLYPHTNASQRQLGAGAESEEGGLTHDVEDSVASDNASLLSGSVAGTGIGGLRLLRRQAEELAKWLDGELEGFTLPSPL